jgi:recombination protein RecT
MTNLTKFKTASEMLKSESSLQRIAMVSPKHVNPQMVLKQVGLAIQKTPNLEKVDPLTLLGGIMTATSLGLLPCTPLGEAHLIPFKNNKKTNDAGRDVYDLTFIIGYQGMLRLMYNSGLVKSIQAHVVSKQDVESGNFKYSYGTETKLFHQPTYIPTELEEIAFAYVHVDMGDGGQAFEVLPAEYLLKKYRNESQAYKTAIKYKNHNTPWITHPEEMMKKTLIRRIFKRLPVAIENINAMSIDDVGGNRNADFEKYALEAKDRFDVPDIIEVEFKEVEEKQSDKTEKAMQAREGAKTAFRSLHETLLNAVKDSASQSDWQDEMDMRETEINTLKEADISLWEDILAAAQEKFSD